MSTVAALAGALLALSLPGAASAAPCTDEFTGPSGGLWAEPSNWTAGLPAASSVVCWDASKQVDLAGGAQSVDSISGGGGLVVRGNGTLDITGAGPSALSGRLEAGEGGILQVHGDLSCGYASLGSGELLVDGTLDCALSASGAGRLRGTGHVASVLNEGGIVEPGDGTAPGGLTVGAFTQTSGTLEVREEGAGGGVVDHPLRAEGAVTLGGTIELDPASPATGFLAVTSASEPQGSFTKVQGPAAGAPWTIEYGPEGAAAVSGGAAPLVPQISGAARPGATLACGPGYAASGPGWQPRGSGTYRWSTVNRIAVAAIAPLKAGQIEPPELVEDALREELSHDQGASIVVPGAALDRDLGCEIFLTMPAGGVPGGVTVRAESKPVRIEGPYHDTLAPKITGRRLPGGRLTCSPGRWEGSPTSFTYQWMRGPQRLAQTAGFKLGTMDQGTFTCIVTAHYGAIAVPAEVSVQVPGPPQPTLCQNRSVALVSVRSAARAVLLFGAAVPRYFGARVIALRRAGPHGRWLRIASGRVNGGGWFELRAPARRAGTRGSYRVQIAGTSSNAMALPGVLQIVSDHSSAGESIVDLRLAKAVRHAATVSVSPLGKECTGPGPAVVSARLAPGGDLRMQLTTLNAEDPAQPGYYLASTVAAGRTYTVELVVPGLTRRLVG